MTSNDKNAGFTLIELLIAMTVFSFMLAIVVVGFINIVRLHNNALAANLAQDNARAAIDEIVKQVRDSAGPVVPAIGASGPVLCLHSASQSNTIYFLAPAAPGGYQTLYRASTTDCVAKQNIMPVTSPSVNVASFTATVSSSNSASPKQSVDLSITVGSNNGTTVGSGASLTCGPTNQDRAFCSVVTLSSGAVPR